MERERKVAVRVGTFVAIGLLVTGFVILLLGQDQNFFSTKNEYFASFSTIEGLKVGAPVRLAGVEVGQVTAIRFYDDPADRRVRVEMEIDSTYEDRIRGDSLALVGNRGLLGDKIVDISQGTPKLAPIADGGEIPAGSSGDFEELMKKGAQVVDNTVAITNDLRTIVGGFATPEAREGMSTAVTAAGDIFKEIRDGKGAIHQLIYDPATGKRMQELVASSADAAEKADAALARVDAVLAQVQRGDGLVGSLFYDPAGEKVLADLGLAAREIGTLAAAARTEEGGLLHSLIYGEEGGAMADDLAKVADDLAAITTKVRAGEGSLGALINDPTVYEDLKTVLGNVRRNRVLRELVRYSISNRGEVEQVGKAP